MVVETADTVQIMNEQDKLDRPIEEFPTLEAPVVHSVDITDYLREAVLLTIDHTNRDTQKIFQVQRAECGIVCDAEQHPLGLVMRDRFFRHLGKLYGSSLYYDKSISKLMEQNVLQVEQTLPVQTIIDLALNREEAFLYDSVILTDQGKLRGFVTVGDLLIISRQLQQFSTAKRMEAIQDTQTMLARIGGLIHSVKDSTVQSAQLSNSMLDMTFDGKNQLSRISSVIHYFTEMTTRQDEQVKQLEQRMKAVSNILLSIREIAEQSNYIAVNAAIEAARAGEHGRGFAVVATEVNKMSVETKRSAGQIAGIIKLVEESVLQTAELVRNGIKETSQSVKQIEQTNTVLQELFLAVTENRSNVTRINEYADAAQNEAVAMQKDIDRIAEGMADSIKR